MNLNSYKDNYTIQRCFHLLLDLSFRSLFCANTSRDTIAINIPKQPLIIQDPFYYSLFLCFGSDNWDTFVLHPGFFTQSPQRAQISLLCKAWWYLSDKDSTAQANTEHIWENTQIITAAKVILKIELVRCRLTDVLHPRFRQAGLAGGTYGPFQLLYCIHAVERNEFTDVTESTCSYVLFILWYFQQANHHEILVPHNLPPSDALSEAQIKTKSCPPIEFPGY